MTNTEIKQAAKDILWMIDNTSGEMYKAKSDWEAESNHQMTKLEWNAVAEEIEGQRTHY